MTASGSRGAPTTTTLLEPDVTTHGEESSPNQQQQQQQQQSKSDPASPLGRTSTRRHLDSNASDTSATTAAVTSVISGPALPGSPGGVGDDTTILRAGGLVLRARSDALSQLDSLQIDKIASGGCGCGSTELDCQHLLEVLLISRRRKPGSYTVPAGKFEKEVDGSFESCALRETVEEAGVQCEILMDLGWYGAFSKDGSRRKTRFFAMRLLQESVAWSEAAERQRSWFSLVDAQPHMDQSPLLADLFVRASESMAYLCRAVLLPLALSRRPSDELCSDMRTRALTQQIRNASGSSEDSGDGGTGRRKQRKSLAAKLRANTKYYDGDGVDDELFGGLAEDIVAVAQAVPPQSRKGSVVEGMGATLSGGQRIASYDQVHVHNADGERFCFYKHQVGGHFCLVKPAPESEHISVQPPKTPPDMPPAQSKVSASGVVLKPLNDYEYAFYQGTLLEHPSFMGYAPKIFGTKKLTHMQLTDMTAKVEHEAEESFLGERMKSHQFQQYIVMEDLADSMQLPRILDLKMGFRQRSKRHSARKRDRCRSKAANSTSHAIGFRICGIHMEEASHDKYWGRSLPLSEMRTALGTFFLHSRATAEERNRQLTNLLQRLQGLHETVSKMRGWRFWNTSLLFLHDGASPGSDPDCRLIDFAHCTRVKSTTPDDEFLYGLENLQVFLEALRDGHPQETWVSDRLKPHPSDGRQQDQEEMEDEEDEGTSPEHQPMQGSPDAGSENLEKMFFESP